MTDYVMEIIPEPKEGTATVIILTKKGKFQTIVDGGEDNYLCGLIECGNIICKNVNRGQVSNIVFKCPNCGSYNVLKGT
jgi:hypothetical protein